MPDAKAASIYGPLPLPLPHTAGGLPLDQRSQEVDSAVLEARAICDCYGLNTAESLNHGEEHPFVRYLAPALRTKDHEIERLKAQLRQSKTKAPAP